MADIKIVEKKSIDFNGAPVTLLVGDDGSHNIDLTEFCISHFKATKYFDGARLPQKVWDKVVNYYQRGRGKKAVLNVAGLSTWIESMRAREMYQRHYKDKLEALQSLPDTVARFVKIPAPHASPDNPGTEAAGDIIVLNRVAEPVIYQGYVLECVRIEEMAYVTFHSLVSPLGKRGDEQAARTRQEGWADMRRVQLPDGRVEWCVNIEHAEGVVFRLPTKGMDAETKRRWAGFATECAGVLSAHFKKGVSVNPRFSAEGVFAEVMRAITERDRQRDERMDKVLGVMSGMLQTISRRLDIVEGKKDPSAMGNLVFDRPFTVLPSPSPRALAAGIHTAAAIARDHKQPDGWGITAIGAALRYLGDRRYTWPDGMGNQSRGHFVDNEAYTDEGRAGLEPWYVAFLEEKERLRVDRCKSYRQTALDKILAQIKPVGDGTYTSAQHFTRRHSSRENVVNLSDKLREKNKAQS